MCFQEWQLTIRKVTCFADSILNRQNRLICFYIREFTKILVSLDKFYKNDTLRS